MTKQDKLLLKKLSDNITTEIINKWDEIISDIHNLKYALFNSKTQKLYHYEQIENVIIENNKNKVIDVSFEEVFSDLKDIDEEIENKILELQENIKEHGNNFLVSDLVNDKNDIKELLQDLQEHVTKLQGATTK